LSIATRRGDSGQTGLPGGIRTSKADPRVECYGTIDELISQIGFARSICGDAEVTAALKAIQRELFKVGSAIGTTPESRKPAPEISAAMLAVLDEHVSRIESIPGVLGDWSLPGELPDASAIDVARTVCRRAERLAVALSESGALSNPQALMYLNRLSDVLWLFGRLLEARANVDSSLRSKETAGPRWSRAW
jgi:cob(I)alamin adenosyltransferase